MKQFITLYIHLSYIIKIYTSYPFIQLTKIQQPCWNKWYDTEKCGTYLASIGESVVDLLCRHFSYVQYYVPNPATAGPITQPVAIFACCISTVIISSVLSDNVPGIRILCTRYRILIKGAENKWSHKRRIYLKGILAYPSPISIVFRYFLWCMILHIHLRIFM